MPEKILDVRETPLKLGAHAARCNPSVPHYDW